MKLRKEQIEEIEEIVNEFIQGWFMTDGGAAERKLRDVLTSRFAPPPPQTWGEKWADEHVFEKHGAVCTNGLGTGVCTRRLDYSNLANARTDIASLLDNARREAFEQAAQKIEGYGSSAWANAIRALKEGGAK